MKLFRTIQKYMAFRGFEKDRYPFNRTQRWYTFVSVLYHTLEIVYPFRVANTPREYMESIFMITTGISIVISSISTILKTTEIFDIIDVFELTINESQCQYSIVEYIYVGYYLNLQKYVLGLKYPQSKALYEKTDQLIERISKIIQFVMVYVSVPGFILPKAIFSLFIYSTTDLGPDALELPLPAW